ncbi:hypothetical protein KPH14_012621 [Odynerus spinipes]|uniref:Endonuclease/exonuclease/phosphatase domain-containing protein n=1 Tax=Odynerus spinipes TaxID=1348599 RepID=A0AAD9RF66_9HYME|nr:hypothetical protein KPH14_012621 [Odynerus spinipes]
MGPEVENEASEAQKALGSDAVSKVESGGIKAVHHPLFFNENTTLSPISVRQPTPYIFLMAADYSSHQTNLESASPTTTTMNNVNQQPASYAAALQTSPFPTKDQAIVIDTVEGIPIKDYVLAVGSLTNPSNIRFVLRISKNRVCMYLASNKIVNDLTENNDTIQIGNTKLKIRPLISKFKRVILSNVCPVIPHLILEQQLTNLNVRLGSTITFLRAGLSDVGLSHIMSFRRQLPKPFILVGDLNSHNYIWGSHKIDSRGRLIERFLDDPNITLLNNNQPTHFNNSYASFSSIDLSICSSSIAHFYTWNASWDLYGSDYFPILIQNLKPTLPYPPQSIQNQPVHWILKKADWSKYKTTISQKVKELKSQISSQSHQDINGKVNTFVNIILDSANESIPKTSNKFHKKQVPWWNDSCLKTLQAYKQAFSHFKRHPTLENKIQYKKLRSTASRTFKENKRLSWSNFISTVNTSTPTTSIWNKLRMINGVKKHTVIPTLITPNNTLKSHPTEIANHLASTFANNSSNSNYSNTFRIIKDTSSSKIEDILRLNINSNPSLNHPIQVIEVTPFLNNGKNSIPGPDAILTPS